MDQLPSLPLHAAVTLHEARHFLNVLAIMEALIPDEVMARLTPLECALSILAAYTHDLGMALSQEEHDAILDEELRVTLDWGTDEEPPPIRANYQVAIKQAENCRQYIAGK